MDDVLTQTLGPSEAILWQQYLSAEAQGKRVRALLDLRGFVQALQDGLEKQRHDFAEAFCRQMVNFGEALPLRQPLFAGVIGPYLVLARQQGKEDAGRWLAYFHPHFLNLPPSERLIELDDSLSSISLLAVAFRQDPNNIQTQDLLIQNLTQQFEYAVHEVPTGVLYGIDGAKVVECQEWLDDLALFREVVQKRGVSEKYEMAMRYWDFHFRGYADYLNHREQYRNYEEYINQHWQV